MRTRANVRGFTLIEMLITMVVIALLVSIALPAYNSATRKAHRADAAAALMNIASRQQQMLLDTRSYGASLTALKVTLPANVAAHYTIAISVGADVKPTFTATATPKGDQVKDTCKTLSIDQNGTKTPSNCW